MTLSAVPDCPVCGASAWSPRRAWTTLRDCADCGTVWNDRSASRREEEARYLDAHRPRDGGDARRAARRWSWVRNLLAAPNGRPPGVLDVGCGAGAFLEQARRSGARAAGIEIDGRAASACAARGLSVTRGSIFDAALPEGPWDLVTFWDVLDQLEDPVAALRLAVRGLAPTGRVLGRGRNALLHAPAKKAARRLAGWTPGVPDPAVVHRWGLSPSGWLAVFRRAGLAEARLHPGLPARLYLLPSVLLTAGRFPPKSGARERPDCA